MFGAKGFQWENRASWLLTTSGALGPQGKLKLCGWVGGLEETPKGKGHMWPDGHGFRHNVENSKPSIPVVSNLDSGLPGD